MYSIHTVYMYMYMYVEHYIHKGNKRDTTLYTYEHNEKESQLDTIHDCMCMCMWNVVMSLSPDYAITESSKDGGCRWVYADGCPNEAGAT